MGLTVDQQRDKIRLVKKNEASKINRPRKWENKILFPDQLLVRGIYFLYQKKEVVYIGQSKTSKPK